MTTNQFNGDPVSPAESKEFVYRGLQISGFVMLLFTFVIIPLVIYLAWDFLKNFPEIVALVSLVLVIIFFWGCKGYFVQEPNEARVMTFFGKYVGTTRKVGFFWVNPFVGRRKLSLRIQNMDIAPIKVNDRIGNPVMIGLVLVWKIDDTYRAVFDIDSQFSVEVLGNFVRIQADAALREVTGHFAYDDTTARPDGLTLRDGGTQINELLEQKLNERLAMAGIEVVEARINYLAYAPEIAAVMLRRQQAVAIVSAREKIVEGAVGMVHLAINKIENEGIARFDDARRAALVSNLMVVLCSDEPAQPVLNTSES